MLNALHLPAILDPNVPDWETRRRQIVDLLLKEEYGFFPREADAITFKEGEPWTTFCAGKAIYTRVTAQVRFGDAAYEFPFAITVPKAGGPHPFFVYIDFRGEESNRYLPTEEIIDRGFAVLHVNYNAVTADKIDQNPAYDSRIYDVLYGDSPVPADGCGTITVWAWAASRMMDYAMTRTDLDFSRAAVLGHSRLGKTALLAGALDARFTHVFSNDSGCSGAAITREKKGERIADIVKTFPYWFCENYHKYAGREAELPFDQHFLLAAIAPRRVYVGSAKEDQWADPDFEFLSCRAADEAYRALGLTGFVAPDRLPEVGDVFADGHIGYHLRAGAHYLSREDWNRYMDYMEK